MRLCIAFLAAGSLFATIASADEDDCPEFVCPANHGTFADPCTCRRFYKCSDGKAFKTFCPSPLYWDDIKKLCTYKSEAVCGPVDDEDIKKQLKQEALERAPKCDDEADCPMPFCFCSKTGESPPAEDPKKLPQFLLITIDGAVNNNNYHFFEDLLGEDLRATFFIQHEYCDYYMVESLYARGHELALLSVTGKSLQSASRQEWAEEMGQMREILRLYANVHPDDILGARAPMLLPGKNAQLEALVEEGLLWDSSVSTKPRPVPVWPYTLDYRIPHECRIKSCPSKSFPGVWEVPLNAHFVSDQTGGHCSHLDQCVFTEQTNDTVFEWIKEDFLRHYEQNRAPYMVSLHTNWFLTDHQREGLKNFVSWVRAELDDAYFATITDYLLWMTDEENLTTGKPPSLLSTEGRNLSCRNPNTCQMPHTNDDGVSDIRYMRTCAECPEVYPWIKRKVKDAGKNEKN